MRRQAFTGIVLATIGALALAAGPALAADGVDVSRGSDNGLVVTVYTEAANVHFSFNPVGCGSNIPCYEITAGTGMVGTPVTAGGGCNAQNGNGYTPSAVVCPAEGVSSITFVFKAGGTWSSYAGSGGEHASGPRSPAPVTVQTGSGGGAMSVNSWNGCHETVICNSSAAEFTAAEVDAADTLRGTCSSVIKH
ncbi:MAG TPA: hypothetical protein VN806_03460 [Caulobacteraceae bacterium]|nr:hypothetical protein [Caulobacteraceae bacterium]